MTVLLHHLTSAARISWGVSATAELGALLAADLRAKIREGTTAHDGPLEEFRGLYEGVRSLIFYTGSLEDGEIGEFAAKSIFQLSNLEFERLSDLTLATIHSTLSDRIHSDTNKVRSDINSFLAEYVENRFVKHWRRAKSRLQRHVETAYEVWKSDSLAEAIDRFVGPAYHGVSSDSVLIEKIYDLTVDAAKRPLRLIPTVLNWPQILVKDEDRTVQIHYSIAPPGARPLMSPAQVTAQMAALSRQHSLAILREVAKRPIGTMSIAERLHVAPATISRTIHELIAVSLLTSHPMGRQRLYRLNVDEFEALGSNVWQVIVR